MPILHECLCVGADPETLRISAQTHIRGNEIRYSVAADPAALQQAFANVQRWDLVLCRVADYFDLGLDVRMAEAADRLDASVILLRPATSTLSPAEALSRGAADLVTLGDREHLLMVMDRELHTGSLRRELRRLRTQIAATTTAGQTVFVAVPQLEDMNQQPAGAQTSDPQQPDTVEPARAPTPAQSDEQRIKRLIEGGGLTLEYQPIVTLRHGTDQHPMFETLLRLRDEQGALLMPGNFFPTAGRRHWLGKLDLWVFRRALPILARMQAANPAMTQLFINLATETLSNPATLDALIATINGASIGNGALVVEVRKDAFAEQPDAMARLAAALSERRHGLLVESVGLADCGLIQASADLISHIKLDPCLVRDPVSVDRSVGELKRLIRCAHNHGVKVIALAVDNATILPRLYTLGVDHIQGHFVSMPYEDLVYPSVYRIEVTPDSPPGTGDE